MCSGREDPRGNGGGVTVIDCIVLDAVEKDLPEVSAHPTARRLRGAREERGLSLEALADQTKIRRHYLEALEQGQFQRCPSPFYARGFVWIVARQLSLDVQDVLAEYDTWGETGLRARGD